MHYILAKPKKSKSKKKKGDQQKNVTKDSSDSLILNVQPKVVDSSVENSSDPVVDNSSSLQSETNTVSKLIKNKKYTHTYSLMLFYIKLNIFCKLLY